MFFRADKYNRKALIKSLNDLWEAETYLSNYDDIVGLFGVILSANHQDDYQGDSIYTIKQNSTHWGLLVVGWGSCSGCDALQMCDTLTDLVELTEELMNDIKWYNTLAQLKQYSTLR